MLKFTRDDIEVKIVSHNKVRYKDREDYPTPITKELLNVSYAPATATHWTYQGGLLRDIYQETYFEVR